MSDLRGLWRGDLCTFLLGCSFSFEQSLEAAGGTNPSPSQAYLLTVHEGGHRQA